MKKEYRIRMIKNGNGYFYGYVVQMKLPVMGWVNIKWFEDEDKDFAKREAEELLEKLNEK